MPIDTHLARELTEGEKEALRHYGADSTFLHAVTLGWAGELNHNPRYEAFSQNCGAMLRALDDAIASSVLIGPATLYSAHGNGFGVRGALQGDPADFVGLTYRYPGFISTSSEIDFCRPFLEPRRHATSRPVMMEFRLPAGFNAVDMQHGEHAGEFEFLLGRDLAFRITRAELMDGDVLSLVLGPEGHGSREVA